MQPFEFYPKDNIHFDIVQIGVGGSGGYLVQRLAKLLSNIKKNSDQTLFTYTLVDADSVEEKNLQRQPFLPNDLDKNKAQVLAARYGKAYQFPIFYREEYVESKQELYDAFHSHQQTFVPSDTHRLFRLLIGCVDNNASRKIMHEYFLEDESLIYLDLGIDGVLKRGNKEQKRLSGYSGQCVLGMHIGNKMLAPVGGVYKNILKDKKSLLPTQSCGQNIVSAPQRMQTNEFASLIAMGYLSQLIGERRIYHHLTNFNALTHISKSIPIPGMKKQVVIQKKSKKKKEDSHA